MVIAAVLVALASASASAVITPGPGGGAGGSGSGSGGGGSGGSSTPITTTITTVYGGEGQLLNDAALNTSYNIPKLAGVPLGTGDAGAASTDDPGDGSAVVGSTVFGVGSAEADQQMGIGYTSRAPGGVESSLSVTAIVDSHDLIGGITGVGGQCGATYVNWSSPTQASTDTLSTCRSSYQFSIPGGETLDDLADEAESTAVEAFGDLDDEEQELIEQAQDGASAAKDVLDAVQTLSGDYDSVWGNRHTSTFTWTGSIMGGTMLDFTVDPEVEAANVGLGTELNFMASNVMFVVTETYTQNQYSYNFGTAEVGWSLAGNKLEQCSQGTCSVVTGNPQLTSGSLPAGMQATEENGDAVLSGAPAAGTQDVYQFDLTVNGNVYDCTLQVAPPLALTEDNGSSTFYYEQGIGFTNKVLPFEVSGGYGASPVELVESASPSWLYLAYNATGTTAILGVSGNPAPGTYTFELDAEDGYTTVTSGQLQIDVVPRLSMTSGTLPSLEAGQRNAQAADLSIWTNGGAGPYTWTIDDCQGCGSLPPGLSLNAADGVISGDPTTNGTYSFIAAATDSADATATAQMSITVWSPPPPAPLEMQTTSLPGGMINSSYSATLAATGGASPYRWSLTSGSLPPGLRLSSDGTISGTPSSEGTFHFTVKVTDSDGNSATATLTITVAPSCPPKICSPPPPA
jgi:hypothetical protein